MKKIAYLLLILSFSTFISCSKDQKVVKQLDGTWKVQSATENGTAVPSSEYEGVTYTFNACKVKKDDCDGTITQGSVSMPFTYRVSEKGTKFTMSFTFMGTTQTETGDIVEHSKDKFVFRSVENGNTSETTLVKI